MLRYIKCTVQFSLFTGLHIREMLQKNYIYIHIYKYIRRCMYVRLHAHIDMYTYVNINENISIYIYTYKYACIYILCQLCTWLTDMLKPCKQWCERKQNTWTFQNNDRFGLYRTGVYLVYKNHFKYKCFCVFFVFFLFFLYESIHFV